MAPMTPNPIEPLMLGEPVRKNGGGATANKSVMVIEAAASVFCVCSKERSERLGSRCEQNQPSARA